MRTSPIRTSPILAALFSKMRREILVATFSQPDREWYLSELAKFLRTQPSSLQREVNALSKAGILSQRPDGRRLYLKPDRDSPIFGELKSFLDKTAGIIPILQQELASFGDAIRLAFLYGSTARSEETSQSDIDLMIVGELGLSDIVPALRRIEKKLGRPVNPTLYSYPEFMTKSRNHDHFLTAVLQGKKQFVKGNEHDLDALIG